MNLHDLSPPEGSRKKKHRHGRGRGSRHGESAGRGNKGQKKRSRVPLYFEGGQTPFYRRVPKRGFHHHVSREVQEINVHSLNRFDEGDELSPQDLIEAGLLEASEPVKLLGKGELNVGLTIRVHAVSAGARNKIEEAGGAVELISDDRDV